VVTAAARQNAPTDGHEGILSFSLCKQFRCFVDRPDGSALVGVTVTRSSASETTSVGLSTMSGPAGGIRHAASVWRVATRFDRLRRRRMDAPPERQHDRDVSALWSSDNPPTFESSGVGRNHLPYQGNHLLDGTEAVTVSLGRIHDFTRSVSGFAHSISEERRRRSNHQMYICFS
jgi:hypothetical protein